MVEHKDRAILNGTMGMEIIKTAFILTTIKAMKTERTMAAMEDIQTTVLYYCVEGERLRDKNKFR